MAKCSFWRGLVRVNTSNLGDLEGPMTGLKSGRYSICMEKGKVIAYIVRGEDLELSKENVKSLETVSTNVSDNGKVFNIYRIEMTNGQVGTLRLVTNTAHKVLMIIQ